MLIIALAPYVAAVAACSLAFVVTLRRGKRSGAESPRGSTPGLTIVECTSPADAATCATNIAAVIGSLRPTDHLIIVADHVGSQALDILRQSASDPRVRVMENNGPKGKKSAQRTGVAASETDVVATIDADCSVGNLFCQEVATAAAPLSSANFMLLLPVEMRADGSLLGRLIEMEFGCLQVMTAGSAILGSPTMANGAGMAFNKTMYAAHDQRTRYASGDDMFLLAHAIGCGAAVRYLLSPRSVVSTAAPSGVGAYLRQRTRWLAKAGGYRSWGVIVLALVVFAGVMSWPMGVALAVAEIISWGEAAVVFAVKLAVDTLACGAWLFFRKGWRGLTGLWVALPLEVVYPVMTVTVAIGAALRDKGKW